MFDVDNHGFLTLCDKWTMYKGLFFMASALNNSEVTLMLMSLSGKAKQNMVKLRSTHT